MKKSQKGKGLVIYQTKKGGVELRGDFSNDTMWATQMQLSNIFNVDVKTINEHIKNIYKTDELKEKATIRKIRIVQPEGNRTVEREVNHYTLDIAIAVGYRVSSKQATQFRIWATGTLKDHLLKGYTVNETRLKEHTAAKLGELEKTIALMTSVKSKHISHSESEGLLTIIKQYTDTWTTLVEYDEGKLQKSASKKKGKVPDVEETFAAIAEFKKNLLKKGEATDIFAQQRNTGDFEGVLKGLGQTFGGKQLYLSIDEKAAHLLYFVVKDHMFVDGNKRTGAFLFLRFLYENKYLTDKKGTVKINDSALTALTLLVAKSDPKDKEVMIALITQLIS
ncbi:MAG: prophage maintenance system killer protein [Acidimicrobiales bacterium]|jgi:prophage maintenance system killer protein